MTVTHLLSADALRTLTAQSRAHEILDRAVYATMVENAEMLRGATDPAQRAVFAGRLACLAYVMERAAAERHDEVGRESAKRARRANEDTEIAAWQAVLNPPAPVAPAKEEKAEPLWPKEERRNFAAGRKACAELTTTRRRYTTVMCFRGHTWNLADLVANTREGTTLHCLTRIPCPDMSETCKTEHVCKAQFTLTHKSLEG